MRQTASQTHLAEAGATQCAMSGCGVLFKRSRRWQAFCSNKCRNDFHARETRIEAIRARAVQMYEALLKIADGFAQGGDAALLAQAAIKDLKAP